MKITGENVIDAITVRLPEEDTRCTDSAIVAALMSPTPRADEMIATAFAASGRWHDFARQLEAELAALRARLAESRENSGLFELAFQEQHTRAERAETERNDLLILTKSLFLVWSDKFSPAAIKEFARVEKAILNRATAGGEKP